MLDVGLRWYVSQSVASYSDPCVVLHAYDPPVFDGHARREQCSGPFYDPSLGAGLALIGRVGIGHLLEALAGQLLRAVLLILRARRRLRFHSQA